jgi:maleamate amidohydrolase
MMKIIDQYKETFEFYIKKGLAGRVGFGQRPALIVIDMIHGFMDLRSLLASNMEDQISAIDRLLDIARAKQITIIFSSVAYDANLQDAGIWIRKIPSAKSLVEGSKWVGVDERLHRRPNEMLLG